jgi:RNA polymerase sigma factor (sigma-70 family)
MPDQEADAALEMRLTDEAPASDDELMQGVKDGDLDKLGLLFGRYGKALFAFFYRLTSNAPASEDLVQNVFIRILKYRNQFRAEGRFTTWMFAVAVNVKNDYFRKTLRSRDELAMRNDEFSDGNDPVRHVETNERAAALKKAIDQLSPEQREALILCRFQGLKSREAARILNCSENTVKARLFRAVERLRKICSAMEN